MCPEGRWLLHCTQPDASKGFKQLLAPSRSDTCTHPNSASEGAGIRVWARRVVSRPVTRDCSRLILRSVRAESTRDCSRLILRSVRAESTLAGLSPTTLESAVLHSISVPGPAFPEPVSPRARLDPQESRQSSVENLSTYLCCVAARRQRRTCLVSPVSSMSFD